jgi:geranylgeranyl diphosphate synthase type I
MPQLEEEMQRALANDNPLVADHYRMLHYHMGWLDQQFRPAQGNRGKHLRPVLCLLAAAAVGGRIEQAMPAAAAVELLHNFSLVHDDIEDGSPARRHRPTVWLLWGKPQAINVGDALFALARAALYGLSDQGLSPDRVLSACQLFDRTCVRLTEGQHLDMAFESRLDVTVDEYMAMIGGKTAALISASLELGALVGGADVQRRERLAVFGYELGLAFQIQDDVLGIWGDEALTGKSAESDILTRKKSLPVVYGLEHAIVGSQLRALYRHSLEPVDVPNVLALLEEAGAESYALSLVQQAHNNALAALQASGVTAGQQAHGVALQDLVESLLDRHQ